MGHVLSTGTHAAMDILSLFGQPTQGRATVVTIGASPVELRPVPSSVELEIRDRIRAPITPTKHAGGGSRSPLVPIDEGDPGWNDHQAAVRKWWARVQAAVVVAARLMASGFARPAAAECEAGADKLLEIVTTDQLARAYAAAKAPLADLSPAALARCEREFVVRMGPADAEPTAEQAWAEASGEGGDGVEAPWSLPDRYGRTEAYYVLRACELFAVRPDLFPLLDAELQTRLVSYARVRTAEVDQLARSAAAAAVAIKG